MGTVQKQYQSGKRWVARVAVQMRYPARTLGHISEALPEPEGHAMSCTSYDVDTVLVREVLYMQWA